MSQDKPRKLEYPILLVRFIAILGLATSPVAAWAQVKAAPPISGVLGQIETVSGASVDIATKSGVVRVGITQPLTTYRQVPSDLSRVTPSSYVGIPSVKQENGTELAQQIMIFPAELRGAAEGSVLLEAAPGATTHSRMTNGSVSQPAASSSRMTNGMVRKGGGTKLVVSYQDGAQTISVSPNVPVTEIAPVKVALGVGDTVYVATTTQPNGALTTSKIFLFVQAASRSAAQ